MKKIIIIKYGELSTKKDNINFFLKTLRDNINNSLKDFKVDIEYNKARLYIYCNETDLDKIIQKLKKVFGIHKIVIGYRFNRDNIDDCLKIINDVEFQSFKVETKRSDKTYQLNSMEFSKDMGSKILGLKKNISVNVHQPEVLFSFEIRFDCILFYYQEIDGLQGYPVGTQKKGLLMLSGGIDSPVAGFLAMKRGIKIEAIYFESPPHTSDNAKNKVIKHCQNLAEYNNQSIKLHVVNFTKIQETIYKELDNTYLITIMRRMMYRISEKIASRNRCLILINGESIGQVASQTLTSINVINRAVNIPVIRPVACLDKNEIIKIAQKINTFETSILPFEDCCTIFVPKHPAINPEINFVMDLEESIPYVELIEETMNNIETITISNEVEENELL